MDFSWSDEQSVLHRRAREFAAAQLSSDRDDPRRQPGLCRDAWSRCGDFGVLGLSAPAEYGGMDLDALTTAHALEGLAEGCEDGGLLFAIGAHLFACVMPIVEHGSEELKQRLLPDLVAGRSVGANAITEAGAGSDVFALDTSARQDGDHYVINGVKSYVSNGPDADVFVVYATVNPEHGYLGLAAFAVERDHPGLRVGEPFDKLGLKSCATSSVYLEDCRVPADNLIGHEGKGAAIFSASMAWERASLFAIYLGTMERQLARTIQHAQQRRQFDKPIGKRQAVAHRIADMRLRLDAARLLLYRATWLRDRGEDATLEVSLSKLAVSEAAIQSGLDAIQIHGGLGVMEDVGIARMLRDAVPATIFSGTSEIQRDLIAARLGL